LTWYGELSGAHIGNLDTAVLVRPEL
jgi:hypothetical protein